MCSCTKNLSLKSPSCVSDVLTKSSLSCFSPCGLRISRETRVKLLWMFMSPFRGTNSCEGQEVPSDFHQTFVPVKGNAIASLRVLENRPGFPDSAHIRSTTVFSVFANRFRAACRVAPTRTSDQSAQRKPLPSEFFRPPRASGTPTASLTSSALLSDCFPDSSEPLSDLICRERKVATSGAAGPKE